MKHYIRVVPLLMFFALCSFWVVAAEKAPSTPDVKAALNAWVEAIETGDVEKVVALYDKNSTMLSAFAIEPITSHKGLTEYYKKVVNEPEISIDVTTQDVRIFDNVAVNTGLYTFHWVQDGETMDVPSRFSFVYVLKDGKWAIISHHSSRVPGK
ncbi:MAG: SgcJ/EcaC family oxidoreductase [Alphaproteobacteria bacterium]